MTFAAFGTSDLCQVGHGYRFFARRTRFGFFLGWFGIGFFSRCIDRCGDDTPGRIVAQYSQHNLVYQCLQFGNKLAGRVVAAFYTAQLVLPYPGESGAFQECFL